MLPQFHISSVKLGVASSADIVRNAVCEVDNTNQSLNSPSDIRMGTMDSTPCGTCRRDVHTCQGHFGYIRLPFKVCNPLFTKRIIQITRATTGHMIIHKKDTDTFYDKTDERDLSADDLEQLLPESDRHLILSVLPVLPIACRPNIFVNGVVHDDDITTQYNDIIKIIQKYNNTHDDKHASNLRFRIRCLLDNTSDKLKHINGRSFMGLKERIVGKSGQIRLYIMGKRVDQSARTVISAEPTLEIDQVGIPQYMAETLYYREVYYQYNRARLEDLVARGLVQSILRADTLARFNIRYVRNRAIVFVDDVYRAGTHQYMTADTMFVFYGDIICRNLMDNDMVLFNRQPTLHRHGMTAMRVRVLSGKTLRINLAITKQFNADFDGDECNIHVPMNLDTRAELSELASVPANILSVQSGAPTLAIVQDTLLGAYLMSARPERLPYHDAVQLLIQVGVEFDELSALPVTPTTLDILSFALPHTMEHAHIVVRGQFVNGVVLDKSLLSNIRTSLIRIIYDQFGADAVLRFVNRMQWIVTAWNATHGFTIGIGDCRRFPVDVDAELTEESAPTLRDRVMVEARDWMVDTGSRLIDTITSGAKGDMFNACQITSLLGQQSVGGRSIQPTITYRRRTFPHVRLDASAVEQIKSRGFITHGFFEGLTSHEYFIHSSASREGICDTALKTASSGYIQRKIVKLTEDVRIMYDGTVRGNDGVIYNMRYGGR